MSETALTREWNLERNVRPLNSNKRRSRRSDFRGHPSLLLVAVNNPPDIDEDIQPLTLSRSPDLGLGRGGTMYKSSFLLLLFLLNICHRD